MPSSAPFRIVFAIYPGMAQLDFTGPHQFLSCLPDSEVLVASAAGGSVPANGLVFAETLRLADINGCDLVCVPGGSYATEVALDEKFVGEVRRLALGARFVTSVCTGSLILGAAGLLQGKRAACHWAYRHLLAEFGAIPDSARVARDGNVITGGGVTAGIDFALTVLAEVAGAEFAKTIQLGLEYAPLPPFDAGNPESAPTEIVERLKADMERVGEPREDQVREAAARLGAMTRLSA